MSATRTTRHTRPRHQHGVHSRKTNHHSRRVPAGVWPLGAASTVDQDGPFLVALALSNGSARSCTARSSRSNCTAMCDTHVLHAETMMLARMWTTTIAATSRAHHSTSLMSPCHSSTAPGAPGWLAHAVAAPLPGRANMAAAIVPITVRTGCADLARPGWPSALAVPRRVLSGAAPRTHSLAMRLKS